MKNKILSSALALCLFATSASPVLAATTRNEIDSVVEKSGETMTSSDLTQDINKQWSWSGYAYLSRDTWNNITTYNNIFPDSPKITNHHSQGMYVRAVDSQNNSLISTTYVGAGRTVTLSKINAFSGKVYFQGQAQTTGDTFYISLT